MAARSSVSIGGGSQYVFEKSIYILIESGSTHSYVFIEVVEYCFLRKVQYNKSWLVQIDTNTKRKVSEVVKELSIELNGLLNKLNLNILPLGYYDSLI